MQTEFHYNYRNDAWKTAENETVLADARKEQGKTQAEIKELLKNVEKHTRKIPPQTLELIVAEYGPDIFLSKSKEKLLDLSKDLLPDHFGFMVNTFGRSLIDEGGFRELHVNSSSFEAIAALWKDATQEDKEHLIDSVTNSSLWT